MWTLCASRRYPPMRRQFVKLIRKLRWIGMENEGNCVHMHHELRRIPPCDVVLATPRETD
jgi:hypothetical protein